jgi:hypothetical protein
LFGLTTKTKLTIDEETLANFIKQSTQQRQKRRNKEREREREREREDPSTKPNPKWFVWFVLQLACVKCVLFMIDQSLVRFMPNYQVLLFTFVNECGCGKKVTELQRRRRT